MAVGSAARAQVPAGGEFQVNTYTTSAQNAPAVALDANGDFVLVWQSLRQDGSWTGIFGRRYSAAGAPKGGEFQVNTYTTSFQDWASVASDGRGNFVVAWRSYGQDGSSDGVFGQRFDAAGVRQGPEFQINTYTPGGQRRPRAAMDAAGNFVVVWESYGQDASDWGIFGQRYDASGNLRGGEFRVNSFTADVQFLASIASDPSGNFVVAWMSWAQDGSDTGVFAQRYDAGGLPSGAEFQVNSFNFSFQGSPAVDIDSSGNVVVAWSSDAQDGDNDGVFARRPSRWTTFPASPTGTAFLRRARVSLSRRRGATSTARR